MAAREGKETGMLVIAGQVAQQGDWLQFRKAPVGRLAEAHVLYMNEHGFIQFAWGPRDAAISGLPVSTGEATDYARYLTEIWRKDASGIWCIVAGTI